ncbi:MAG: hypothetical protein PF569_02355 [Candidatus Woesearchaeota archaeon]|jgi:hypothetical protein|nr:hypothetical protein [Candidatus Woesearchaeota archaeon]
MKDNTLFKDMNWMLKADCKHCNDLRLQGLVIIEEEKAKKKKQEERNKTKKAETKESNMIRISDLDYEPKDELQRIFDQLLDEYNKNGGFVYVEFLFGQRKGSIAKLVSKEPPKLKDNNISPYNSKSTYTPYYPEVLYSGEYRWDDRYNKPKGDIAYDNVSWLRNYRGNTKWCFTSAKAVKEEALKKPQYDIDGKMLSIGDKVLYIDHLSKKLKHGVIDEFKAHYDTTFSYANVYTFVKFGNRQSRSRTKCPSASVYKINR